MENPGLVAIIFAHSPTRSLPPKGSFLLAIALFLSAFYHRYSARMSALPKNLYDIGILK